jgi:hypothetical protein
MSLLPQASLAPLALALLLVPTDARKFGPSRADVHTIIIHAVSAPACVAGRVVYSGAPGDAMRWKRFFDAHPVLGIHYIVDRSGIVAISTPENQAANHARGHNDGSIGIELVHRSDGLEPFGDDQIEALIELIRSIRRRHTIPVENIKSHAEIDDRTFFCGGKAFKGRMDPGENFPWSRLRAALRDETPHGGSADLPPPASKSGEEP